MGAKRTCNAQVVSGEPEKDEESSHGSHDYNRNRWNRKVGFDLVMKFWCGRKR